MAIELSITTVLALTAVAFVAGLVDAIGGGGGLLTVPALLAAGIPVPFILGTNKGASLFGSGAALVRFFRAGLLRGSRLWLQAGAALAGSLGGASLVSFVDPQHMKPLVLVLLLGAAVVMAFVRPNATAEDRAEPAHPLEKLVAISFIIGAYDGFFGPGTGTFLILALVAVMHFSLQRATANAKVVNFASNIAAAGLFFSRGLVLWKVSLPMAAGQLVGGYVGAHLAMKGGDRLVRRVVLGVVLALVARLGYDLFR